MVIASDKVTLQENSFLSKCSPSEIASLLPYLTREHYSSGDFILREGEPLDRMFFVLHGKISNIKTLHIDLGIVDLAPKQKPHIIQSFPAGQHCCEQALAYDAPMASDLIAEDDSELFSLSRRSFAMINKKENSLTCKLLMATAGHLAERACRHEKSAVIKAENQVLIEQMRMEKKKITAMHRIAGSTAKSSVKNTLETILDACMDCLSVEKGSVMIHDRGRLRVEAAFGPDQDEIIGKVREIDETSISGRCFIRQKPILIKDIEEYQGIKRAGNGKKYQNNSLLSIPLVSLQGESIGVLNVSKTSEQLFSENDRDILADLATEAGATLGHEIFLARLFKSFQETYSEVKKARDQMSIIEEKIFNLMDDSWQEKKADEGRKTS